MADTCTTHPRGSMLLFSHKLCSAYQQVSLDEAGAEAGCAVLDPHGDLVVGRDEAFYFNTLDGRGPCFACEGQSSHAAVS